MGCQVVQNFNTQPFILGGAPLKKSTTIAQDAARSTILARYTVMAKISASGKWVPWTSVAGTDGSAKPRGIYLGNDIAAADLVAGDVVESDIIVGGDLLLLDKDLLVFENSLTSATIHATGTIYSTTAEDILRELGIYLKDSADINNYENQ